MTDEPPERGPSQRGATNGRPTRRLSPLSRVRGSVRRGLDRALGADGVWSVAFVLLVVLLVEFRGCAPTPDQLVLGEKSIQDIKASAEYDWVDEELTERLRRQARDQVPDVYLHEIDHGLRLARRLASVFEQGREVLEQPGGEALVRESVRSVSPAAMDVLLEKRFDPALERELTQALRSAMEARVVANKGLIEHEPAVLLKPVQGGPLERVDRYDDFIELEQARTQARSLVASRLDLEGPALTALGDFVASFVDANVYYDTEATADARREARNSVPPVIVRVEEGQVLVRRGQRITAEVQERVRQALRAAGPEHGWRELPGLVFLVGMLSFFIYRYTRYHQRGFRKLRHLPSLMLSMLLLMLLLSRALLWIATQIADELPAAFSRLDAYTYLMPLGAGAILVALLANGRIATVYSAFGALLFAMLNGWDGYLAIWAMVVQCAGVFAISTYRERAALLRAGFVVGGVGALAAAAIELLRMSGATTEHVLVCAALAFLGGAVGVGLIVSFCLPLLESLYNVLTDIRLLELSNANNPLLAELAVKAPGSYNHSLVVGTLAEEAAKAIGANALFCRVAAIYHDIGKANMPEYFVENQHGTNPHDALTPNMSALIIAAHVKDGIKIARERGLPEMIVDIIPQHHGTRLMSYFYDKARKLADPALGPVAEQDFRYPGPKPQTREAAIFMIADGIEAAARTVEPASSSKLREVIRRVTNAIVLDGQLEECDLTFSDLDRIQQALLRCLLGMRHQRIDYPGFDFRGPEAGATQAAADQHPEPEPASADRDRPEAGSRS